MSRPVLLVTIAAVAMIVLLLSRWISGPSPTDSRVEMQGNGQAELQLEKWHEFTAPSEKFRVLVPSLPQHATEKLEDPQTKEPRQYDMYVSEKDDGSIFMISIITMLDKTQGKVDEGVVSKIIHDMTKASPESKLKAMNMGKYGEHQAIDFSIEGARVNIDGKAFMVENTLYILTAAAQPKYYNRKEVDFFLNSFRLLPEASKKKEEVQPVPRISTPVQVPVS